MVNKAVATKAPSQADIIAKLTADNAALEAKLAEKRKAPPISLKVSPKKGVSVYGLGRFPVTLYASQMRALITLIKSGQVDTFLTEHATELAEKPAA